MTPEAMKELQDILKELTAACFREMGQEWCTKMFNRINELANAGLT